MMYFLTNRFVVLVKTPVISTGMDALFMTMMESSRGWSTSFQVCILK